MITREPTNRAYTYGRKSTAAQSALSFAGQRKDMLELVAHHGLVEVEYFEDERSGLDADNRQNFLRMIDKVLDPENEVTNLVFYDLSRFTRSKIDPYVYLRLLDEHDITVHTVLDGTRSETDDIAWDVKFSLNHEQSRKISILTLRGQRDAIEAGFSCSSKIPYGYKRGWVEGSKGQLHPIYVPHEVHAEHVRMMYRMRDEGRRTGEICEHLMGLGIPSPTGLNRWSKGSITFILKNRANIGELHYFKTSKSKFPRNRRLHKHMVFVGGHEKLVDEDLFNRVQQSIADNTRPGTASPRSNVSPNPLSELVKCAHCSSGSDDPAPNMVVKNGRDGKELICSAKKATGVAYCRSDNVPLEPFLNIIVSALLDRALTKDVLEEQILHINENSSHLVAEERQRQTAIKKRIREIDRESGSLTKKIMTYEDSHPLAVRNLMDDLEQLGKEKQGLESQSSALDVDVAETMAFATEPEAIIEAAMDLRTYLEADDTSTARTLLRGFIKRVDVAHGAATIHYGLPLPNTQETESGYSTTVPLDDDEILLEQRSPARAGIDPGSPTGSR